MKQSYLIGGALFLGGILLISSMSSSSPDDSNPASVEGQQIVELSESSSSTMDSAVSTPINEDISLQATRTSPTEISISWSLPENLKGKQVRLVRGPQANPTIPGNFWFAQGTERSEIIWCNLPIRDEYIRLCIFEDGECSTYSSSILVTQ